MTLAEPGNQPPTDPWLTVGEIANELRVHPATVRLWVADGWLNAIRPGRRKLLVRRSELDRVLSEAVHTGHSPQPTGVGNGGGRSAALGVEVPAELHAALAGEARRQRVTLNMLIVALLADALTPGAP
jgi:excisionase family DNA binding protein